MLFLLFGSSASGKSYTVARLCDSLPGVEVHDFDEVGVPKHPTVGWRYAANEQWLQQALDAQSRGLDILVAGQTPLGEMLAAPSGLTVAVRGCLVDCDDDTRVARLRARGDDWLEQAGGSLDDYVAWGQWMRGHARDPHFRLEVIRYDDSLHWDRLDTHALCDYWPITIIDTTRPVEEVVSEVRRWVRQGQRAPTLSRPSSPTQPRR